MAIIKVIIAIFLISISVSGLLGVGVDGNQTPKKLFVFGDSSADTGNTDKYPFPYGITFPGHPSGRASNGHIAIDYLARYMDIDVPVSYEKRYSGDVKNGMNLAYGRAAVFKAFTNYPNVRTQVDLFKKLIKKGVYKVDDLKNSVAIISYGGNDYSYATFLNPEKANDTQFWIDTMGKVVKELQLQLQIIYDLGVPKVIINTLAPLGCVPQQTFKNNYTACAAKPNEDVKDIHNTMLYGILKQLNTVNKTFFALDYFNAVLSVIENKGTHGIMFEEVYRPCCEGPCRDANKNHTLCADPNTRFYWDAVHFSDQGWRAIYEFLKSIGYTITASIVIVVVKRVICFHKNGAGSKA